MHIVYINYAQSALWHGCFSSSS